MITTGTLLIVDDEPTNLTVLSRTLQPHYRVRAANSGAAALRAARIAPKPDLVLLDVMMPDLDGYGVLQAFRADPELADIPVIFVTALGAEEDEERGLAEGAVDFLTKPIRPSIVLARVRTQLALRAARESLRDRNAWLESEVAQRTREIAVMQDVTLTLLAGLVETRDVDTGHHTVRTQAYVEILGHELRRMPRYAETLTAPALDLMIKAAPLHDIGKIGIPDAVLLKPARLTPDEFAQMKGHARIGGEAIARAMSRVDAVVAPETSRRALSFLETARQMALWHHERWDGNGYPDGLAGEAIPLCARLMAVADVFDALTTRRVYKPAMSAAAALAEVFAGHGTQFDPDVTDALAASQAAFVAVVRRYGDASEDASA